MAETESGRAAINAPLVQSEDAADSIDAESKPYRSMSVHTLLSLLAEGRDIVGMASRGGSGSSHEVVEETRARKEQLAVLQPFARSIVDRLTLA
jgi:hypothetical protein